MCGTPVPAILDQNKLTGLAGGVGEGQNIAEKGPHFRLWSPPEAPKWVKDLGYGLKSIRGSWGDHLGYISGVLSPFGGSLEGSKAQCEALSRQYFDLP